MCSYAGFLLRQFLPALAAYAVTPTTAPVFDSSDKYAYAYALVDLDGETGIVPFVRMSNGFPTYNSNFTVKGQTSDLNLNRAPIASVSFAVTADPYEHLAVFTTGFSSDGGGQPPLASYTINPKTGGISSTNGQDTAGVISIDMSYDGKFVALGGGGVRVFNFRGVAPPTILTPLLLPGVQIDQVTWDKADHLYAVSYETQKLCIFNVCGEGGTEIESISIPGVYGNNGIIVVPK
jgi:hypothetical protein